VRGLSLGVDYWNIQQHNVIDSLPWENALLYYDKYGDRFIRGPVDPAYPNLPGPIIGYDARLMNLGSTRTSGIDVSFAWNAPTQEWGTVRVTLQGTYVLQWEKQLDTVNFVSLLGTDAFGDVIPRWRSQLTLNWNYGPWGTTVAQAYTAGYTEPLPEVSGGTRKVEPFAPWDIQGTYTGFVGWQLVAGIRNLFNKDPPVSNQRDFFQVGYNPQVANPLGRVYYLRVTYSWK
jgi:iron complex outermembrane receptor protein